MSVHPSDLWQLQANTSSTYIYTRLWRFLSCSLWRWRSWRQSNLQEGGGTDQSSRVYEVITWQCEVIASADRGRCSRIMAEAAVDNMRRHQQQQQQHVWPCSVVGMMMMLLLLQLELIQVAEGLQLGYYTGTCPNVESIVKGVLSQQMQHNRGVAAGVLRLHFHDCFVDVSNHHRYPMPLLMQNHSVICDLVSSVNRSPFSCASYVIMHSWWENSRSLLGKIIVLRGFKVPWTKELKLECECQ